MTVKEFFKEKINWKFYNFLLYNLTKIEDENENIKYNLSVAVMAGDSTYANFHNIFSSGSYKESSETLTKAYIKAYNENELFYIIRFFKDVDYMILNELHGLLYDKVLDIDSTYYDDDTYVNAMEYFKSGSTLPVLFLKPIA